MERIAVAFGLVLAALGIIGFIGSEHRAPTALIPAYVGMALAVCGLVVMVKPAARKHAMHFAAMIGLLGFLGAAGKLVSGLMKGSPSTLAIISQAGMAIVCALFVALAVRSFVAARRAREAGGA